MKPFTLAPAELALGIETAQQAGGVALATLEGRLLAHFWRDRQAPLSASLLADLDAVFQDGGTDRTRVRAIGVSLGPGAFTSLRVGLTLAKSLAHGWGAALYGFSSLALAAARWPAPGATVAVLLDARRGELYTGVYRTRAGEAPEPLRPDAVEPFERFLEWAAGLPGPVVFTGNGAALHRETLAQACPQATWAPPGLDAPGADAAALAAARAFAAGAPPLDPMAVAPVYLRPSDAEKRHGIDTGINWSR